MASMHRTIERSIARNYIRKFKKAPRRVAAGSRREVNNILSAGNQPVSADKIPTAAKGFKSIVKRIVRKVLSWLA